MGGFGSLYVGTSGLQMSQNALNTTAHNLANTDTKGYTRQQIVMSDRIYNPLKESYLSLSQIGLGTNIAAVRQVRDFFRDAEYRTSIGRQGFYEASYTTVYEVQNYFGELESIKFNNSLQELQNAVAEVAKQPDDSVRLAALKEMAVTFVSRAGAVYKGLVDYQVNMNLEINNSIDAINKLSQTIYELNIQIRDVELGGAEHANDLRDVRNSALDELSSYLNISYYEDAEGIVHVQTEGQQLVTGMTYHKMDTKIDNANGFAIPYWPHLGAEVFDFSIPISTKMNTDIGSLKAMVLARGDHKATYADMPIKPTMPTEPIEPTKPIEPDADDYETTEEYNAAMEEYNAAMEEYNAAMEEYDAAVAAYPAAMAKYDADLDRYNQVLKEYNTYTSSSVILNIQAELDRLFNGIVTAMNDIFCPNKIVTFTDDSGKTHTLTVLDEDKASYGKDGQQGVELFARKNTPRYTEQTYVLDSGETVTYQVYNEPDLSNPLDKSTWYTIGQVVVNEEVLKDPTSLGTIKANKEADFALGEALADAWTNAFAPLNPNVLDSCDFLDYYKALISDLANLGFVYGGTADAMAQASRYLDNKRSEVTGVSSDEELTNMIKFQSAYNAASRYLTTVSEMLEHIILTLGS